VARCRGGTKSGHARASRTLSPSAAKIARDGAPRVCPLSPINLTVHIYSQKRPASPPPTRTESPHDTTTQQKSAHTPSRETHATHATFLHSPLRSRLSLCVVSRGSFTCASHRRQLRYTGIELTVQRLVTIRAAGASSERERASPPRGALQARHVVSIQSSAIPSRVTAHHQGARVQHTPRSVHRVPRAVVMFRHVSSCFRHVPLSAAIGWASRPRMSHDCHLMATDEP
jgi:hypothetical protein